MAACASYMCPGNFTVWFKDTGAPADDLTDVGFSTGFIRIPEVVSWELTPSVTKPTAFRTADTLGVKVTPNCSSSIEWEASVGVKLCVGNWLYSKILTVISSGSNADGLYAGSSGLDGWWFFSWDPALKDVGTIVAGQFTDAINDGVLFYGTANPPGISGSNDGDEVATQDFTITVSVGPYISAQA